MSEALPTIAIIGSCVSRDLFNEKLNPGWRSRLVLGATHYQSSVLSVFGDVLELAPGSLHDVDEHTRQCVAAEFTRQFSRALRGPAPDLLLVDFFSDTAFNSIRVGDGYVTDNRWKLATSREYRRFDGFPRVGVDHDVEAFGEALMRSFMMLRAALQHYWPSTKVVVNRARAASEWVDPNGARHAFERASVQEFNARWEWIESNFLRCFPDAAVIDPMDEGVLADAEHPWGKYWVHYEPWFYQKANALLCEAAGVPVGALPSKTEAPVATAQPAPALTRGEVTAPETAATSTFAFEDIALEWRAIDGTADRRHLMVVLSGFRPAGAPYDLAVKTASQLGCDVLWIRDTVDGECTYYISRGGSDVVFRGVQELIRTAARERGLSLADVSIAGFSKGGSAAILHGAALEVGTVFASVPQSRIGTYVATNWPAVLEHMGSAVAELDALVPRALEQMQRSSAAPHLFVLTSSKDPQYAEEIAPVVPLVRGLTNGQLLVSEWAKITDHQSVTRENHELFVSVMSLVCQGLVPRFAVEQFGRHKDRDAVLDAQWSHGEHVSQLGSMSFDDEGRLHVTGDAFFRGRPLDGYGIAQRKLVLESRRHTVAFDLGTVLDETVSARYHRRAWCDYKAGAFTTVGGAGIDISELPPGTYGLSIEVTEHDRQAQLALDAAQVKATFGCAGSQAFDVVVAGESNRAELRVVDFRRVPRAQRRHFALGDFEMADGRLKISGRYACEGIRVREWGEARYFLLLRGYSGDFSRPLGIVDRPDDALPFADPDSYRKSYFMSIGGRGVDLAGIPDGAYDVWLGVVGGELADAVDSGRSLTVSSGVPAPVG